MARIAADSAEAKRIDTALAEWRQGDLALGEQWFVHVGDPSEPMSEAAAEAEGSGVQALSSEVAGLVVVTQTCDIVRSCAVRPYVEVSPLVSLESDDFVTVVRGRRPNLATLPAVRDQNLAADLDRVMTIEKSLVTHWTRTPGYESDQDGRAFALALARKRSRFAFPDDFNAFAQKLQARMLDKHEKNSEEGGALRALRQIRVQASPEWQADKVKLHFWFIRNDSEPDFDGKQWSAFAEGWLNLIPASGRFTQVEAQVVTLAEMTAAEYVGSDALDLDHLSVAKAK